MRKLFDECPAPHDIEGQRAWCNEVRSDIEHYLKVHRQPGEDAAHLERVLVEIQGRLEFINNHKNPEANQP